MCGNVINDYCVNLLYVLQLLKVILKLKFAFISYTRIKLHRPITAVGYYLILITYSRPEYMSCIHLLLHNRG